MTDAVGSGELHVMTEFDFKTPINATVIYYDSDEDVKPLNGRENNSNDMAKNINTSVSEILEDICNASNKTNNENQVSTKKRKLSIEAKNKKKRKEVKQNKCRENNTDFVYQNQTESLANMRSDKTISTEVQSGSTMQRRETVLQSSSSTKIVTNALQFPNNNQIGANIMQSANNMQIITTTPKSLNNNQTTTNNVQRSNEKHSFASITQTAFPQNQDNINTQANECLQTLLNTVSTHLILIMKAYAEYETATRVTSDTKLLEKAKKRFQDAKYHFFYLSFSAVANIMLPNENKNNFVENFVDSTVKMAKLKHFCFKHADMRLLCTEMFGWVKSHARHPFLSELLSKTPQSLQTTIPSNINNYHEQQGCDETNNVDRTCLFRSEPHNREMVISLNSTVQNSRQQYNDVNMSVHNVQSSKQLAQPLPSNTNLLSYSNLPSYTNPLSYANPPSYTDPPSYSNSQSYANAPSYANPPSYLNIPSYMQEFQAFNSRQDCNRQPPIHQPKSKKRQAKAQPKLHYSPTSQDKTLRPPPWRNEPVIPENVINPAYCERFLPDQGQVEVGQNRSLSRDSGFMSPLSSVPNDPMCSPPRNDQTDSSTLVITHVTSLNPSVAYMKDGTCYVCNKLTKQICLGCYKIYYCSNQCQREDWRNHYLNCKL